MNFVCPKCTRRYNIADERVRGRTVNVRCKACQTIIPVTGPDPFAEESTRALSPDDLRKLRETERALSKAPPAPPAASDAVWFIMVEGQQEGPLAEAQLRVAADAQRLTARTFVWKEGMADWKRAAEISELRALLPQQQRPVPRPPAPVASPRPPSKPVQQAPRTDAAPLASLFDDVEVETRGTPTPRKKESAPADPFANLTSNEVEPPAPGEATQFFMAQAGVSRRNPPWKIALFAVAAVGVPALMLYVLSTTNVVTLPFAKPADDRDKAVVSDWEPGEADEALKARMLGQDGASAVEAPVPPDEEPARRPGVRRAAGTRPPEPANEAAALYAMDDKRDVGPIARRSQVVSAAGAGGGEGPAPENIARVVGDRQAAFQSCVEQELRRNPNFKGGRVGLTVTVASSGAVTAAQLDRRDLDGMPVGDCITGTARKMIFAGFNGDPLQLVIPLVLSFN